MPVLLILNVRLSKDQYNPNSILFFFWSIFILVPLILNTKSALSLEGIFFVVLCLIVFNIGAIYTGKIYFKKNVHPLNLNLERLNRTLGWLMILGLVCIFLDYNSQGFTLSQLFTNFFATTNSFMSKRYNGSASNGIYISLANILAYVTAVLGGIVHTNMGSWKYILKGLIVSLGITLIRSSKGSLLLSLVFFIGATLVTKGKAGQRLIKLNYLGKYLFFGVLLMLILVLSFISRGAYELSSEDAFDNILSYLSRYSSGHLFAYSDWFNDYISHGREYDKFDYQPGFLTFMSLFQLLGNTDEVSPGIYTEYFNDGVVKSNIYTIFRGLITDFGLYGTILFWLIFGIFSNCIYSLLKTAKNYWIWLPIYMGIIGFIYSSFIVSLLVWKSVVISVITLMFILKFHKMRC